MTTRPLLLAFLLFCFVLVAYPQANKDKAVGINEKLGSQIDLDSALKDEEGNVVSLRKYMDKPTILMFVYFRCPGICPVLINSMVEAVNAIKLQPGKDFRVIAVSFDPSDTPEMAREKKANYLSLIKRPFAPDDWRFLTGTESKAVADSAGFEYHKVGDMYVHPGAIMLLTPKGILSRYIYGSTVLPADVEMGIKEAAGGLVRPTVSRVLTFCYTYDPQGRGYVFSVTRFVGAITLLFAAIFIIFVLRWKLKK
jgi:protein SCO1